MIQYRNKSSDSIFQEVKGVTTTQYSNDGLSPHSEYECRVTAIINIGCGPPSNCVETHQWTGPLLNTSACASLHVECRHNAASVGTPEEPNRQIKTSPLQLQHDSWHLSTPETTASKLSPQAWLLIWPIGSGCWVSTLLVTYPVKSRLRRGEQAATVCGSVFYVFIWMCCQKSARYTDSVMHGVRTQMKMIGDGRINKRRAVY